MFATTLLSPALQRVSVAAINFLQKFLMVVGLIFIIGLLGMQGTRPDLIDGLKSFMPAAEASPEGDAEVPEVPAEAAGGELSPRMLGVLEYVSRRYRVSHEALQPIFSTAQEVGQELKLDPLLIIAVIGVESGFNPFSQSVYGAQGLMQVVPRFHQDKLPEEANSFLDPVTNVQVGARVLKESIFRNGGLENGLQQFGGALKDPERRYAGKVLAEKMRLEQAVQRKRAASAAAASRA